MERQPQEILNELRAKGTPIYSYSKLGTINNCKYEAYRTYILNDRENAENNIYANLGGKIHDVLEDIMNGKATTSDLLPAMNKELEDMEMLDIEFPKGRDGADTIRQGWVQNMTHFCNTYIPPTGKFETEQFFLYETPNHHYLQGYIDLIRHNNDGTLSIYDYKTSSMYRGKDIDDHAKQLILYAMGLEQQGYKIKNIAWIFLKYAEVRYTGKKTIKSKNETSISKVCERKNIVKDLKDVIESKLIALGMDEVDIEIALMNAIENNTIPKEVVDQFEIVPYVMKYELSDETRQDANDYFDTTIEEWEKLSKNEYDYPHRPFTKIQKSGKEVEEIFFCTALCGYKKRCPYIKEFLDTKDNPNEDDSLF